MTEALPPAITVAGIEAGRIEIEVEGIPGKTAGSGIPLQRRFPLRQLEIPRIHPDHVTTLVGAPVHLAAGDRHHIKVGEVGRDGSGEIGQVQKPGPADAGSLSK